MTAIPRIEAARAVVIDALKGGYALDEARSALDELVALAHRAEEADVRT